MRKRLNVPMRLAIVASVLWTLGGTLWVLQDMNQAPVALYTIQYQTCSQLSENGGQSLVSCMNEPDKLLEKSRNDNLTIAPFIALTILAIAWLAGWIVIKTARWVLAGRDQQGG